MDFELEIKMVLPVLCRYNKEQVALNLYVLPSSTEVAQVPSYFGSKNKGIHERKHRKIIRHFRATACLTIMKLV
jgi:hypothetical protein